MYCRDNSCQNYHQGLTKIITEPTNALYPNHQHYFQSLTCSRSSPCEPPVLETAEEPLAPAEAEASAGLCCGPFSPPEADAVAAGAAPFVSPITASLDHRTIFGKADPAFKVTCTASGVTHMDPTPASEVTSKSLASGHHRHSRRDMCTHFTLSLSLYFRYLLLLFLLALS